MVFVIALIFAFRIFGFMAILPVIATAAVGYEDYSVLLIGFVIGVYGLLQACLHIPMGYLSDKFGRRRIVLFGLVLMFLGSVLAAVSTSVYGLLFGRAIQGAGAIGSVLNAWCADLTNDKSRTKAMALIGMTIGLTFFLAIIFGPIIVANTSLSGLFWVNALCAVMAMLLTMLLPEPAKRSTGAFKAHIKAIISNNALLKLDYGIFAVHASYTALFLLIPSWVNAYVGAANAWHFYVPLVLSAVLISLPAMFFAEARGKLRLVLLITAFGLFLAHALLIVHGFSWIFALFLYFSTFTVLEAILPSMLAKHAPKSSKGTAMGVFSCAQYLGIFAGGAVGGWLLNNEGVDYLIYFGLLLSLIWLVLAVKLPVIATKN